MGAIAIVMTAVFVVATFGWILVDTRRSKKRDLMLSLQSETRTIFLGEQEKSSGVHELETSVRKKMAIIQRSAAATPEPPVMDPEMTPTGLRGVGENQDDTRRMRAVREKADEIIRIVEKKARA